MTRANVFKMMISMTKAMMYCYDVMHVSKSVISDENYDNHNGDCVKTIGECLSINEGLWHIGYDEFSEHDKSIWFYKTRLNNNGKATGYIPKYWIDISDLKQFDICGEIGYYLMQIMNDMRQI